MNLPFRGLTISALCLLAGCESFTSNEPGVVYALGSREAFTSPLQTPLRPVGQALEFDGLAFDLTSSHIRLLDGLAAEWPNQKPRYLIAGYAPPTVPADYARAVAERRAQAVRQHLIEHGVEAANLQTVGFGQDATPAGPAIHVVVIYAQP